MIKENGHEWDGFGNNRCHYCSMKFNYYCDIKRASKEQPERQDLKEWMKCKEGND